MRGLGGGVKAVRSSTADAAGQLRPAIAVVGRPDPLGSLQSGLGKGARDRAPPHLQPAAPACAQVRPMGGGMGQH